MVVRLLSSTFSLTFILFGFTSGCVPLIQPIPESAVNTDTEIQCDISNNAPCSSIIDKMVWEKQYGNTDIWDEAVSIDRIKEVLFSPLRDGLELRGRADASSGLNLYDLYISSTLIKDSGMWRCKVIGDDGESYTSIRMELVVTKTLTTDDILFTRYPSEHFVISEPYIYTCGSREVYPEVDVTWEINGVPHSENIKNNNKMVGYLWTIESVLTLSWDNPSPVTLKCIFTKSNGIQWTENKEMTPAPIQYPAVIEGGEKNANTVELSSVLELYCLASGTDVEFVWKLNGSTVDTALFNTDNRNVTGTFEYGQTTALNETITWIPPSNSYICSELRRHQGKYTCEARGLVKVENRILGDVNVLHPPCKQESVPTRFDVKRGSTFNIECPCEYESSVTYKWTFDNSSIRDGIAGENSRNLTIQEVIENDFVSPFVCAATNDYGNNVFPVQLIALSAGLSAGEIAGIVIGCVSCIACSLLVGFLIYRKKKKSVPDTKKTVHAETELAEKIDTNIPNTSTDSQK